MSVRLQIEATRGSAHWQAHHSSRRGRDACVHAGRDPRFGQGRLAGCAGRAASRFCPAIPTIFPRSGVETIRQIGAALVHGVDRPPSPTWRVSGFQSERLRMVSEGVAFRSHLTGPRTFLLPKSDGGADWLCADIIMAFTSVRVSGGCSAGATRWSDAALGGTLQGLFLSTSTGSWEAHNGCGASLRGADEGVRPYVGAGGAGSGVYAGFVRHCAGGDGP